MSKKKSEFTCDDCFFRRAGLCALEMERPCPTFRADARGALAPPQHPRLVPRPAVPFGAQAVPA